MTIFDNSPLLKDGQELTKTKGTIWKPLIAVSSLSIFSFISGQYLPYVIAAISGSGAIVAVPLAIFAVSTAVALILTIYLIRLAVSRADNKKEEPQKSVCENCNNLGNKLIGEGPVKQGSGSKTEVRGSEYVDTNSENKSSMPTPQQSPLTLGTSIPQNNNAPPPPPPSFQNSSTQSNLTDFRNALIAEIPKGITLKSREERDKIEEKRLRKQEAKKLGDNGNQQHPNDIATALNKHMNKIRKGVESSDSENEHSSSSDDSGWITDEDKDKQKEQKKKVQTKHERKSTSSTLQSDNNKRSESPESGYGDDVGSRATSPLHPEQKTEESLLPPSSCIDSPSAAQVNNDPVNSEVQDPSALSVKEHIKKFGGGALNYQKQSVAQRS